MFLYLVSGLLVGSAASFAVAYFYFKAKNASLVSNVRSMEEFTTLEEEKKSLENLLHTRNIELARKEQDLENLKRNTETEKALLVSSHERELDTALRNMEEKLLLERKNASGVLEETKNFYEEKLALEKKNSAAILEEAGKTFEAEKSALCNTIEAMKKAFEENKEEAEKSFRVRTDLLKEEFKVLSEKILSEKSASLQNNNKEQWTELLAPLNEKCFFSARLWKKRLLRLRHMW